MSFGTFVLISYLAWLLYLSRLFFFCLLTLFADPNFRHLELRTLNLEDGLILH